MLSACVQKRSILRVIKFNKYLFDVFVPDANISKSKIGLESPIRSFSAATAMGSKLLTIDSLNPCVKNVEYAVRGPIVQLASKLEKELQQGIAKPFQDVVKANIGDCHAVGQNPITFIRQVISACTCPELIAQKVFPDDVNKRSSEILNAVKNSVGCYTDSQGIEFVRKSVAAYIEKRDGYPADPGNIFLTNGASSGVKLMLECFVSSEVKSGVMIPIPQYPLYSATISEYGLHQIGYYLNEEENWKLDISELKRSLEEAKKRCQPRVLCVINPGNPTGQVLSYQNIKEIIEFCMDEGLFLLADEVYQDNTYGTESFHSFKKVLRDMGSKGDDFEMASFHSVSKGYMGECGIRGGYVEVIGLRDDVMVQLQKLQSAQLCANSIGQIVVDCITNPPKPGDESYDLFMLEKTKVLESLKTRAKMVYEILNTIEGVTCNEVMGAMYAFPRVNLPKKAIAKAESVGERPDFFYCKNMLLETGLCVVPGSGFGQKDGTFHFRMTILPPVEQIKSFLERFKSFHLKFLETYS
ncbi:alanine aminotransferase 1-like [Rhopilema esculentum]|uniref:alanine aminotransferase 1-like n=1 Tax=Rhopilema esculentum TaxID=499914 RepID=UPI0031D496C4|eukprot:gene1351-15751_t